MTLDNFYKTQAWYKLRNSYMKEKSYLCEDCFASGILTSAEEVHHIIPLTESNVNDANVSLNKKNLVCLCRLCHRARHKGTKRRYAVDNLGHVIPMG